MLVLKLQLKFISLVISLNSLKSPLNLTSIKLNNWIFYTSIKISLYLLKRLNTFPNIHIFFIPHQFISRPTLKHAPRGSISFDISNFLLLLFSYLLNFTTFSSFYHFLKSFIMCMTMINFFDHQRKFSFVEKNWNNGIG